jgi:hypothetical protein
MRTRWTGLCLLAGSSFVLAGWDCGSGTAHPPPGPSSTCATQGPSEGVACDVALTGAVTAAFSCTSAFARYDAPSNTTALVQIGAHPGTSTVGSINITLAFDGMPAVGPEALIPATAAEKPNNIILFANGGGDSTFQTFYTGPDAGQMALTLVSAEVGSASDGGVSDLWCIHGHLAADIPGVDNPSVIVHMTASF